MQRHSDLVPRGNKEGLEICLNPWTQQDADLADRCQPLPASSFRLTPNILPLDITLNKVLRPCLKESDVTKCVHLPLPAD